MLRMEPNLFDIILAEVYEDLKKEVCLFDLINASLNMKIWMW